MPNVVMSDGALIFDLLGSSSRWPCFGVRPSEALMAAAASRGLPLHVLQGDAPDLVRVYGRQLLLVRPDQHIAWRGSACDSPGVANVIIARAVGWGN